VPTIPLEAIRVALLGVRDPELGDNVVDLGMYQGADVDPETGDIVVHLALTTAACPLRSQIQHDIETRLASLAGAGQVKVRTSEMDRDQKRAVMERARWKARDQAPDTEIPGRTQILAISSGKGGVGKSSVTVNLATTLAVRGFTVGILDADIAGFSIPRMLGLSGQIEIRPAAGHDPKKLMEPLRKQVGAGELRVLSMGFLAGEDEAIMWRGLMLNRGVQHFIEDAAWGDLDYLLVDMPPGTGDVQMGLARLLPRAEMLIVTTPALAAQKVASRAADMARKGYLRVAGIIENMSGFTCAHGEHYDLFGAGGGQRLADQVGAPLLAQIPIEPQISAGGDTGIPAALGDGPVAAAFAALADQILVIAPPVVMTDCSARLVEALDAALGR
jgi:ATP-binding protein involved in chromosome partitioning